MSVIASPPNFKRQVPADPKTEQLIKQVDGEVQSLNQLVSEFLDFARPTPLQTEAVDLSDVVASVLALLDAELRAGTIEVQTINLETLPTIEADADQLKWMFTNLVKNAAQAMDRGGTIAVPPLRERRADIPLLVAHFLETSKALDLRRNMLELLRDNLAARLEYAFAANDSNDSTRTYADNAYSMQLQYSF